MTALAFSCNSCVQEVSRGQALGAHASTDLAELAGVYAALARAYREEYIMYNLPAAALAQAHMCCIAFSFTTCIFCLTAQL